MVIKSKLKFGDNIVDYGDITEEKLLEYFGKTSFQQVEQHIYEHQHQHIEYIHEIASTMMYISYEKGSKYTKMFLEVSLKL